MKEKKHPKVDKLPDGALSIKTYADQIGVSTAHVYKLQREGKLADKGVQLVVFQTYNFVVPLEREG